MVRMILSFVIIAITIGLCCKAYCSIAQEQKHLVWILVGKLLALIAFTTAFVIGIIAAF
jgi:hypothetical protein